MIKVTGMYPTKRWILVSSTVEYGKDDGQEKGL
jgi:hypothetical protein